MKDVISKYGNDLDTDVIVVLCECGDSSHSIVISHDKFDEKRPYPKQFNFMVSQTYGMNFCRRVKQAWRYLWHGDYFCDAAVLLDPNEVKELGEKLTTLANKDMEDYNNKFKNSKWDYNFQGNDQKGKIQAMER